MKQLHVIQVGFLRPMIEGLLNSGVSLKPHFSTSQLEKFDLENPNNWVPASCVFSFFESIARRETGPNLPIEIIKAYRMENMAEWGDHISHMTDVHDACVAACQTEARTLSFEKLNFLTPGLDSQLSDSFLLPKGIHKDWLEVLNLHLMLDGFRVACGPEWLPTEIQCSENVYALFEPVIGNEKTKIKLVRDGIALRFPSNILSKKMKQIESSTLNENFLPIFNTSASFAVEQCLNSSSSNGPITLHEVALLGEISPRSLQRRLSEEQISFAEIVDNWRMKATIDLLCDEKYSINEISEIVRYSDLSNFVRAFKRWTSTTPSKFRETLIVQQ